MSRDVPRTEDQLRFVRDQADRASSTEEKARHQLDGATRARIFWDDLYAELSAGHYASALLALRRGEDGGVSLEDLEEPSRLHLLEIRGECERNARDTAARFGRTFPEAARAAELQIDSTSRHPRYTFEQGFIRVEIDDRKFTAKVSTRDGDETVLGLDIMPLVEHIRSERRRLFEQRDFDPDSLLSSIYTAYRAVLRAENGRDGDEVPLRRLTRRLSKNLNHFSSDEFNIALSRLIRSNHLVVDGNRLHFNHSRNARQGMLLYGLEQGGYVGFISFKKEEGA